MISASQAQQLHHGVSQQIRNLQETIRRQSSQNTEVSAGGNQSTVIVSSPGAPYAQAENFAYKVKIINPVKKSEFIIRHLHNISIKFVSVRVKLIDEFKEQVPDSLDFNVGYYEGSPQVRMWLVNSDDVEMMYKKVPNGKTITLWCECVTRQEKA